MKALYALILIGMSVQPLVACVETTETSMTPCYPSYFSIYDFDEINELDLREMIDRCEEIAAKNATPVPGIATDMAAGLDLWAEDIAENDLPGITLIQPSQEELTRSLADRWADDIIDDVFEGITVIPPSQEELTGSLADRWTDDAHWLDDYLWFNDE